MRGSISLPVAVVILALCFGCKSTPDLYSGNLTPCGDEPEWISRGSGEFAEGDEKALYAVGVASGEPSLSLKRKKALLDARLELSRQLRVYVASLTRNLQQSHKDYFDESTASSIEFFQEASKALTEAELKGSKAVAWWACPITGELFVLVKMPDQDLLDLYKQRVQKMAREQEAELFKEKTEEALKKLDEELDKLHLRKSRGNLLD